MQITNMSTK